MNERLHFSGFFRFGLASSLAWHFVWIFIFIPSKPSFIFKPAEGQAIFLGPLLRATDFYRTLRAAGFNPRPAIIVRRQDDFSREAYFEKTSLLVNKPKPVYEARTSEAPDVSVLTRPTEILEPKMDIFFGVMDAADYLEGVNFSDLKDIVSKEGLSAFVEFKVFVAADGRVEVLRKMNSSGDPVVDLSIMRWLKKSILKNPPKEKSWVRIRIKTRQNVAN